MMSSVKKKRPLLDPEAAPWISASKKQYAALQHEDVVSWIWEFSYLYSQNKLGVEDVRPGVEDAHGTQIWTPEMFTPPEQWDVVTKQIGSTRASPQLEHTSWAGSQPISSHAAILSDPGMDLSTGFTVRVTSAVSQPPPNFSRPLPRPPIPNAACQVPGPEGGKKKPKYHKKTRIKDLLRCMLERPDFARSQCDNSTPPATHRDLADYVYDPFTRSRHPDPYLRDIMQPPGQLPVETLRPPGRIPRNEPRPPDQVPKHSLRPPEQISPEVLRPPDRLPAETTRHQASRFNEDLPPPDPRPRHTAARLISKLRGKMTLLHLGQNLRRSKKTPALGQFQTERIKQGVEDSSASSWSSNIKHCLQSFPLGKKSRRGDSDRRQHVDSVLTAIQEGHSLETAPTSCQGRNKIPSLKPRAAERESKGSIVSTSGSKNSFASSTQSRYKKPHLLVNIPAVPLVALEPFQCTFCLVQCAGKEEWFDHERSFHFQDPEWTSNPPDPADERDDRTAHSTWSKASRARNILRKLRSSASSSRKSHSSTDGCSHSSHLEQPQDWCWNCGFCDTILCSWDQRQEHLADEHFKKGETMSLWDPLKSPYPWRRGSATPITGLPCWDLPSFLSMQRPTLVDAIRQVGDTQKQQHLCKICQIRHPSLEASMRHTKLWHRPRDTWSCPTVTATTNLTGFFEENNDKEGNTSDICYACEEQLQRPEYLDREIRMRHLKEVHSFDECACWERCFSEQQFFLHLANAHDVHFDLVREFMDSCKADGKPPALMTEDVHGGA